MRRFWAVGLAALALAIVSAYAAATWPAFRPRYVRVVGNHVVGTREIVARARIDPRTNLWFQNPHAIALRVESIPFVLTARVHRRLPAIVTIDVSERTPFANVRIGSELAVVDSSLRVLELGDGPALPTLDLDSSAAVRPGATLSDSGARALRDVLFALRANGERATELRSNDGEVSTTLSGGVRVLLGDEDSASNAVPLIAPILAHFALVGRSVRVLDLRAPATPVVTESAPAPRASTFHPHVFTHCPQGVRHPRANPHARACRKSL